MGGSASVQQQESGAEITVDVPRVDSQSSCTQCALRSVCADAAAGKGKQLHGARGELLSVDGRRGSAGGVRGVAHVGAESLFCQVDEQSGVELFLWARNHRSGG